MPHISSKKIDEKDFERIYGQFVSIFNTTGKENSGDKLFEEFFTETEKSMFAKRLAIIFMINEGISIHYISEVLFVSPSTVQRISLKYEIGRYSHIRNIIKKNKTTIWDSIEEIIRHGVENQTGKRRWKWFNEIQNKYNK